LTHELERVSDGAGAGLVQEVEEALLATEIDGRGKFIIKNYMLHCDAR